MRRLWRRLRFALLFRVWPWQVPANVVTFLSLAPPTALDVQRTKQLADRFGWDRAQ